MVSVTPNSFGKVTYGLPGLLFFWLPSNQVSQVSLNTRPPSDENCIWSTQLRLLCNSLLCCSCTIDWKKGKNVTVKVIKKMQKHKGRGTKRTVTKTVQNDSFFNFFGPPAGNLSSCLCSCF